MVWVCGMANLACHRDALPVLYEIQGILQLNKTWEVGEQGSSLDLNLMVSIHNYSAATDVCISGPV